MRYVKHLKRKYRRVTMIARDIFVNQTKGNLYMGSLRHYHHLQVSIRLLIPIEVPSLDFVLFMRHLNMLGKPVLQKKQQTSTI